MLFTNLVRKRIRLVGLVPCAVGGTVIKEWARREHLYENMVKKVRAAMKEGEGGEVAVASGDEKYMEIVREAQLRIKLPNVACVDAKGLPLKGDNLHLTTEAQVKLGQMLADAYLNNFDSSKPSSS
ncbi:hypothetical protein Ancab_028323 [Ancistrocladus abbreviatus]